MTCLNCKLFLFFIIILIMDAIPLYAENNLKVEVLMTGDWGKKAGEFGIEKEGKTETGHVVDFFIANDNIYILDSMNNRIQIFDLQGNFKELIKLQINWRDFGLPRSFTLFQNHFYMLVGKPPYYGWDGIQEINKFSYKGKFIKSFGNEYIPKMQEEYFYSIQSVSNNGYLLCGLGGIKVLAFDAEGNFKRTLMEAKTQEVIELMGIDSEGNPLIKKSNIEKNIRRTLLLDIKDNLIKKEINGSFSWVDKKNNFYSIRTTTMRKKDTSFTEIKIYNPETMLSKTFQITGDVKVIKNNKEKVFHYTGDFSGKNNVDSEGNIYNLMAFEDGVLLRKITWK